MEGGERREKEVPPSPSSLLPPSMPPTTIHSNSVYSPGTTVARYSYMSQSRFQYPGLSVEASSFNLT